MVEERQAGSDHQIVAAVRARSLARGETHVPGPPQELVRLAAQPLPLGLEQPAQPDERPPLDPLREVVSHALELPGRDRRVFVDHPLDYVPILRNEHREDPPRRHGQEMDRSQAKSLDPRREHEAELPRVFGEQVRGLTWGLSRRDRVEGTIEQPLVVGAEEANLEQLVDEDPQPHRRRDASRRCVRLRDQAALVELGEGVADARRGQRRRHQVRQRRRRHRPGLSHVSCDQRAQHGRLPLGQGDRLRGAVDPRLLGRGHGYQGSRGNHRSLASNRNRLA